MSLSSQLGKTKNFHIIGVKIITPFSDSSLISSSSFSTAFPHIIIEVIIEATLDIPIYYYSEEAEN